MLKSDLTVIEIDRAEICRLTAAEIALALATGLSEEGEKLLLHTPRPGLNERLAEVVDEAVDSAVGIVRLRIESIEGERRIVAPLPRTFRHALTGRIAPMLQRLIVATATSVWLARANATASAELFSAEAEREAAALRQLLAARTFPTPPIVIPPRK